METDNQVSSNEVTPSSATPAVDTAPAASSAPVSEASPADGQTPAPWTPDFKVKVMDKDYEVDEFIRPLAKDEESLKKVKRLQEQVLGLPHLEASREEWKNKYASAEPRLNEYSRVEQRLNKLSHYVQKQDFDSFFEELKIPEQVVLNWVKNKLDREQLPPDVRQQMEQARQIAAKNYDAEQELSYYREQFAQTQRQQQFQMIDQSIAQVAGDVAKQFNERIGEPEAFRNAVLNKGVAIQQSTGQRLPVEQVIDLVKKDLARVMGIVEGAPPVVQQSAQGTPQSQKPVIPAIKAGNASPVKQPPKSIDELKKLAASM